MFTGFEEAHNKRNWNDWWAIETELNSLELFNPLYSLFSGLNEVAEDVQSIWQSVTSSTGGSWKKKTIAVTRILVTYFQCNIWRSTRTSEIQGQMRRKYREKWCVAIDGSRLNFSTKSDASGNQEIYINKLCGLLVPYCIFHDTCTRSCRHGFYTSWWKPTHVQLQLEVWFRFLRIVPHQKSVEGPGGVEDI